MTIQLQPQKLLPLARNAPATDLIDIVKTWVAENEKAKTKKLKSTTIKVVE